MTGKDVIAKIDDMINPIVVKEVRQYLNGRTVVALILGSLLLEFVIMVVFMINGGDEIRGCGRNFFSSILFLLSLACVFGIAFPVVGRIARERKDDSFQLIYNTALSPYRIVSGKLLSCMTIVALLVSLCLPFMSVSYYMRGIDMSVIMNSVFTLLLCLVPFIQLMILLGLLSSNSVLRSVVIIFTVMFFLFVLSPGVTPLFLFGHGGMGWTGSYIFWLLWMALISLLTTGGLYLLSVAIISPPASNRATPIRIYLVVLWVTTLLIAVGEALYHHKSINLEIWTTCMLFLFGGSGLVSIVEREVQSGRVLSRVPSGWFRRVVYFLFSTGFANGFMFSLLFLLLTGLLSLATTGDIHDLFRYNRPEKVGFGTAVYLMAYAGLAIGIKHFLLRFISRVNMMAVIGILICGVIGLPVAAAVIIYQDSCFFGDRLAPFMILNPIIFAFRKYYTEGMIFAMILLVFALILMWPTLRRQIKRHFPSRQASTTAAGAETENGTDTADA
ncbi:MAG: hypothetical protein PHQ27_00400 [Victivallales bacterium]|nr:hypothetical protein [Victivallales bacterium]